MTLVAQKIAKSYRRRAVLGGVDLEVRTHEIVGLLGPNGAGKTTTFRVLAGLVRPDSGAVFLDGKDVTRLALHRRARLGLGYLPQRASVFRSLTVRDNLEAVLALQPGLTAAQRSRRADQYLEAFDLTDRARLIADRLSGGERRRLELARCWVTEPRWLLLDEPFAGIDPLGVVDLQARLRAMRGPNVAILITDHQVRATLPLCDRAYLLSGGFVLEHGTRVDLANSASARSAYLGPDFPLEKSDR